ncbi:DUF805 domain-containing protein [Salinibacterium sp. NSLL150]|uniref:DUF805 domain-containing protein n=1 Tax=unclassified Salinibacterium TaxID=2632331 RepID=UPI0018CEA2FE|nr:MULTISPECIES: DUF805 domain-containing protein [unclassified Salinibacterium]MBH0024246.1 DUF805 domain-containing protein [Salinibacterium sp. SWN248]MBH0099215.1 DUF805 domain-containing protein [Salinibacterium sp. NSLL35]MBH0101969.1 DUF805 domain-containing protein [Salinibacterium sp. NSLL150]MBH0104729.1 DUF805 domain-containing protein [Salinibacterium sp. NSLL16]MBH0107489.1 DUF805 domain-containing protein [Salinibacterium sp. NSLL17]
MTFFESIATVFRKYADFTGVASRPEYWWFALFSFITSGIAASLDPSSGNDFGHMGANFGLSVGLSAAWSLALLVPQLAVTVRRLRDTGRNWTNIFWILVPIAGAIVLIVFLTQPSVTQQSVAGQVPPQVAETS